MNFLVIQGGDALINLDKVSSVDISDDTCWEVTLDSGEVFSLEDEDLEAFYNALPAPVQRSLAAGVSV